MSKNKKDSLGDRMKIYESVSKTYLMRRNPVIIRLDGKAFHTFTKGLDKPFDLDFVNIMQKTMKSLCEEIQGCVLGFTQSDEITLVLIDYKNIDTCAWFDNQVQKMASISASLATLYFNQNIFELTYDSTCDSYQKWNNRMFKATFDSRVFSLPQFEVINNLIWRQQDATRNSILTVAQCLYSHKELQGINTKDLQNKMLTEKDINWNDFSTTLKRGSCCIKDENGKWFIDNNIPIFTEDRNYVNKLILLND